MSGTDAGDRLNLVLFAPRVNWAGLGRIVSDVSCRLPESVRQTIVLFGGKPVFPLGGPVRTLGADSRKQLPVKGLRLFLNAMKFRKILKELKPVAVLVFHHDARAVNLLAQISLPRLRCRTIVVALDVPTQYRKYFAGSRDRLHNILIYCIMRHAHRIIATAEGVKADLVAGFKAQSQKIDVIYASVDSEKIRQMSLEAVEHSWFSDNIPLVVASGRFVFQKNQADLLKAFAMALREKPCRLVLIGDGPERDALSRLVSDLGLSDHVLFLGYQPNPFKFIARSGVFAFTSLFDAQPLALLETMALGCPIVAYDCPGGTREMLAPGTKASADLDGFEEAEYGLLVPTGKVETFAKAIVRVLDDPQIRARYSRLGRERAAQFSMEDMADNYLRVIRTVATTRVLAPGS